ncbi:MAG: T9SS type A sorting domain-containing protein [Flavipsychrobacter sp.]
MKNHYFKLFFAIVLTLSLGKSFSQCIPLLKTDSAQLVFDGPVNKFLVWDHYLFAGGSFSSVGKLTGAFTELRINNTLGLSIEPVIGTANGIPDGKGHIIIYGSFNKIGEHTASNIAMVDSSTGKWRLFNVTTDGEIRCAAINNGTLYIGGYFTKVNGISRNHIAAVDIATATVTGWNPNITNPAGSLPCRVECMFYFAGTIYTGGVFSQVGSSIRLNIAGIDATTGVANNWIPNAFFNSAPGYGNVRKMLRYYNTIYICGDFDFVGGKSHSDVAAIDMSTGLSTNWTPNPNSVVYGIANKGDTLYLSGAFYQMGSQVRKGFAAFSISTGNLLPITINTNKQLSEYVDEIGVFGDTIVLGGLFDTIANQSRKNIAAFNRLNGGILSFNNMVNGEVMHVNNYWGRLFIGGSFYSAGRKERKNIAVLDLDADTVVPLYPKVNGTINRMAADKHHIYLSGDFTQVNNVARNYNAAIDALTGKITNWDPQADSGFTDLVRYSDDIYMGGSFGHVRGNVHKGLVRLDTLGNPKSASPGLTDGYVNCMNVYNDTMYIGGGFSKLGDSSRRNFGAINLQTYKPNTWPLGSDTVTAIARTNDSIFIATMTTDSAGPKSVCHRYDITHHKDLTWATNALFRGIIREIFADAYQRLYTVGNYKTVHRALHPNNEMEQWSGASITNVPDSMPPPPPPAQPTLYMFGILDFFNPSITNLDSMQTLAVYGNHLYLGGAFYDINTNTHDAQVYQISNPLESNLGVDTNQICEGSFATLRVRANNTFGPTYDWVKNGVHVNNPLPYYKYIPVDSDSIICYVKSPMSNCYADQYDTTESIVLRVFPVVTPDISISGPATEEAGKQVVVKATVKNAATGYTIEWFNKGVSIGKTTVDSIVYTKGTGTDSIYAVITPRTDTCYVTDTSSLITVDETPVGISSVTGDASIKVYPNPFDTYVRITGLNNGDVIQVYDVTGRRIWNSISTDKEYLLPTKEMHAGIYVLNVTDRSGLPKKHLLIEKR